MANHVLVGGKTGAWTGDKSHRLMDESKSVAWSKDHGDTIYGAAVGGGIFAFGGVSASSITTRAYDEDGTALWTADHGATVYAVAVDSAGNVYTGGARTDSKTTRKYNSAGTLQWSADHGDTVYSIAVDASGNVYTGGLPVSNVKIRKYNSAGTVDAGWNLEWATGGGFSYPEPVYGLCCDSTHLYGVKYRGTSNQDTVRKWALSNASVVWSKQIELVMKGVAVDSSGNVYICGERNFGSEHLYKLNSSGTTQWQKDPGGYGGTGTSVGVDSDGNVYAGASNGVYKYNSSGTYQWTYDHGWNVYAVFVAAAAPAPITTDVPGLSFGILLGTPSSTLFITVPSLAFPLSLGVPTSVAGTPTDFSDLAATVSALAALDSRWTPYVGMSHESLSAIASTVYSGVIAGTDSSMIRFAISALQCTRRVGQSSWCVVEIPFTSGLYDALAAKIDGDMLIDSGFRLPSGLTTYGPFLNLVLTEVERSEQAHSASIKATGRIINPAYTATTRTLAHQSRVQTLEDGRIVVTGDVDPLLRPNDTLIAGDASIIVGAISYRIDPVQATMTATEAAD